MVDKLQIASTLRKYFVAGSDHHAFREHEFKVDDEGVVHSETDVIATRKMPMGRLPVKFGVITGDFVVANMGLDTLEGGPHAVTGKYNCSQNHLTTLAHAPQHRVQDFNCYQNDLTDLTHCPPVYGELDFGANKLQTLESLPPCDLAFGFQNPIKTCRGVPGHVHELIIYYDPHLPLLGLLALHAAQLANPDTGEYMESLYEILNSYMGNGELNKSDMIKCAASLIKAGYKENARW